MVVYPIDFTEQSEHRAMNITQMSDEELTELEEQGEREVHLWQLTEEVTDIPPMLPARGPLYQIAFEVEDYRTLRGPHDMLNERTHPIYADPGRHGPESDLFLYFLDTDGYTIEFTADIGESTRVWWFVKGWQARAKTWSGGIDADDLDE